MATELEILKRPQLQIDDECPSWFDLVQYPATLPSVMIENPRFQSDGVTHFGLKRVPQPVERCVETYFSCRACALDCVDAVDADCFRAELRSLLTEYAQDDTVPFDLVTSSESGGVS